MRNTIEAALDALRNGEVIVVSDNEDRENEGDFVCAAEFATPENINFMAIYGKGLICMPLSAARAQELDLSLMIDANTDAHQTAFTISVDHIETTTGISAFERSMTALKMTDDAMRPQDLKRPGHLFPLIAKDGGVLVRDGHTEATVDLMKLAGLKPMGLCCEIMAEDGSMMKYQELVALAKHHDLVYITIQQLKQYLSNTRHNVVRMSEVVLPTEYGDFTMIGYQEVGTDKEHFALVRGAVSGANSVMTRVHSECLTGDVLGSLRCDCGAQLHEAMRRISLADSGVLVYLRQEGRGIGLFNKMKAYVLQEKGLDTVEANHALGFKDDERTYEVASGIFKDLNISSIQLMTNNPDKINQLSNLGVEVVNRIALEIEPNSHDHTYLKTKKDKMSHILKQL